MDDMRAFELARRLSLSFCASFCFFLGPPPCLSFLLLLSPVSRQGVHLSRVSLLSSFFVSAAG